MPLTPELVPPCSVCDSVASADPSKLPNLGLLVMMRMVPPIEPEP